MAAMEIFLFLVVCLTLAYIRAQRKPKGFPSGPWGLPIFGHLPLLGLAPHKTAMAWKSKYGPIIGVDFGSFPAVIINDYKLIREAFASSLFVARPHFQYSIDIFGGDTLEGLIFNTGRGLTEQRKFTTRTLREFGVGRKSLQDIILQDVHDLIERLKTDVGVPIETSTKFNMALVNTLWTIVTGQRLGHDDEEANAILDVMHKVIKENVLVALSIFTPSYVKYLPKCLTGDYYEQSLRMYQLARDFIAPSVDLHLESHVAGQVSRDFIDAYIDEMKSTTDPELSFHPSKKLPILATLSDLFLAGIETTSAQMVWLFLLLASYPDVQSNLVGEIEAVLGSSRQPTLDDRKRMPYTMAVIYEVLRSRAVAPLGMFHAATEDLDFHGHKIPKGTMVFGNLYEAHQNVEFWGDPQNFRPERFLSEDGTQFVGKDAFLAFSTGKRVCIGESLARDEMFLFTVGLFQVFHVGLDPCSPKPSLEPMCGTIAGAAHHKLVLQLRHSS